MLRLTVISIGFCLCSLVWAQEEIPVLNRDLEDSGLSTDSPSSHFDKARYYADAEDYVSALVFLDQFLWEEGLNVDAFLLKAEILASTGDLNSASDYYKKSIIHSETPDPKSYIALIGILSHQERIDEALFYCHQALKSLANMHWDGQEDISGKDFTHTIKDVMKTLNAKRDETSLSNPNHQQATIR